MQDMHEEVIVGLIKLRFVLMDLYGSGEPDLETAKRYISLFRNA